MLRNKSNSHLPDSNQAEGRLPCLVYPSMLCPRRYWAVLPSRLRPSLFASD